MDDEIKQWIRTARASRSLRRHASFVSQSSQQPGGTPAARSAYDDHALASLPSLSDRVRDVESILLLLHLHYIQPPSSASRGRPMYVMWYLPRP